MNFAHPTFLLRLAVVVILLMHSLPTMLDGSINDFGRQYLDRQGFAPFGLYLAWAIKLSHVAAALCLLLDRYVTWAGGVTIGILIVGIFMVHLPDGWFVVGRGRNGVEFNVLLIAALLTIMFPRGLKENYREQTN